MKHGVNPFGKKNWVLKKSKHSPILWKHAQNVAQMKGFGLRPTVRKVMPNANTVERYLSSARYCLIQTNPNLLRKMTRRILLESWDSSKKTSKIAIELWTIINPVQSWWPPSPFLLLRSRIEYRQALLKHLLPLWAYVIFQSMTNSGSFQGTQFCFKVSCNTM